MLFRSLRAGLTLGGPRAASSGEAEETQPVPEAAAPAPAPCPGLRLQPLAPRLQSPRLHFLDPGSGSRGKGKEWGCDKSGKIIEKTGGETF